MEREMNTAESHVIYLLNSLVTSQLWHVASHDSLTLHVKVNNIEFEEKCLIKTHENKYLCHETTKRIF